MLLPRTYCHNSLPNRQSPEVAPSAVRIMKDAAQPQAWARNPRPPSAGEGGGGDAQGVRRGIGILKGNGPFGVLGAWREKGTEGEHLLLTSSALANFKLPGSHTAAGTLGRLPRAASTERFPRAGQAPPDSVHASRSCGARRGDAGRARRVRVSAAQSAASGRVRGTVRAQTGAGGGDSGKQGDSE